MRSLFVTRQFCCCGVHNLILVDGSNERSIKIKVFRVHYCSLLNTLHFYLGASMHDFPKLAAQVRGARALLGWSQSYLAEGIRVRRMIIVDFESCKLEPQESTLSAIMAELSAAGIVFTEAGVEFSEWPPRPYVPTGCTTIKKRTRRRWCTRALQAIS